MHILLRYIHKLMEEKLVRYIIFARGFKIIIYKFIIKRNKLFLKKFKYYEFLY